MIDIDGLIKQMTVEEKISLLAGADLWHTVRLPKLGIPSIKVTDGPNGARGAWGSLGRPSALFPVGIALGATWNPGLVERVGAALAEEVRDKGAHLLLAPTVNIHRTPVAGRNFECFAEDPLLSGRIASAYIRGMQSHGAGACIKHFVCNDQEFERNSISATVAERPLREIYLEPFRIAIRDAGPWAVMSSYNRVNGIFASENDTLLNTILKSEWGFDGLVMSDWFGTYSPGVPAGGLDLEMPGPARWMAPEKVRRALESGDLTTDRLDDKVRRLLRTIERAGAFADPELRPERGENRPEHRALIRQAAREAIVLLVNKRGSLPLDPARARKIAVIGELARWPNVLGGGSSRVTPHYIVSPLDGIVARAGQSASVNYEIGCWIHKSMPVLEPGGLKSEDGKPGLTLRLYDNLDFSGAPAYEEVTDRANFGWFDNCVPNVDQQRFCMRLTGTFTPAQSGEHTFGLLSVGLARLYLNDELILDNWDVNTPNVEKSVRRALAAGRPVTLRVDFRWEGSSLWRSVRIGYLPPHSADLIRGAVAAAKKADVAIVLAGLTSEWESEGFDRDDMELPGDQNELIERVAAANPNTIVVLNAGSPLAMPWIDKVAAVVEQWYNSQECGNALADVLFGDVNPSGKLPVTFPVRYEDNPASINYPGENGAVLYGEGLFVGYRYYDAKKLAPLFPFGHGLSYTTFEYSDLRLGASSFSDAAGLDLSFDVRNTGRRAGQEVVQVYVRDVQAALVRPEKELKAFVKLDLAPGRGTTVTLHLDREAFWYYNPARGGWQTESGEFEILVGASSRDIRLRAAATLVSARPIGAHLGLDSTLRQLLHDEAGSAILARHFGAWMHTPDLQKALDLTVEQLAEIAPQILTHEKLHALAEELAGA